MRTFARESFSVFLILCGALLISAQLRLRILVGSPLGEDYQAHPAEAFALLALAALGAALIARRARLSPFAGVLVAILLAFLLNALLIPALSPLQLAYFVAAATLIGRTTAGPYRAGARLEDDLAMLWQNRLLTSIWTQYNVRSRYSQTLLGILWIVLLPVSTALVFTLVFGIFLQIGQVGDVPFLSFFLTGVTFWTAFNQGISGAVSSVVGKMGLINQIYFPREILVLVRLLEALVDTFFTFVVLLLLNALVGYLPSPVYLMLIPVFIIQMVFTAGVMLAVAVLTVFLRDVPQLVGVALQILFYLTPILYPASSIPPSFQFVTLVNPLVPLMDAYRSIMLDYQPPDVLSLYYPLVVGLVLLYVGYRTFKRQEMTMQDYV